MLQVLQQLIYSPEIKPLHYSFNSNLDTEYVLINSKDVYSSNELKIIDRLKRVYYLGVISNFLISCVCKKRLLVSKPRRKTNKNRKKKNIERHRKKKNRRRR